VLALVGECFARLFYISSVLTLEVAAFSSGALTTAASGFAASDGSVSFALNIPDENDTSLYFVLAGPSTSSWIVSPTTLLTTNSNLSSLLAWGTTR
jgi:hypothetical protein